MKQTGAQAARQLFRCSQARSPGHSISQAEDLTRPG
jgi:hypothetical protein